MVSVRQPGFGSGEISPGLHGRTELREYSTGLAVARNCVVTPHGSVRTRTGTQWVMDLGAAGNKVRLIPFVFSESDRGVLVFTAGSISLVKPDPSDVRHKWTSEVIASTPYVDADLRDLQAAQVGNLVTVVSPNHDPYDLVRSGSSWTFKRCQLTARRFKGQPFPPLYLFTGFPLVAKHPTLPLEGDVDNLPREWLWAISYVVRLSNGEVFETAAARVVSYYDRNYYNPAEVFASNDLNEQTQFFSDVIEGVDDKIGPLPSLVHVSPTFPIRIYIPWSGKDSPHKGNSLTSSFYRYDNTHNAFLVETRIYRGRDSSLATNNGGDGVSDSGAWGYVGSTAGEFFEDIGGEPDYARPPRFEGSHPFYIYSPTLTGSVSDRVIGTRKPRAVCFFEGRRFFGGVDDFPFRLYGSRTSRYDDHQLVQTNAQADAPIEFDIAGVRAQGIRHIIASERLIVLTTSDEWVVSGSGQNDPLAANQIPWVRSLGTERGSATLAPVRIGGTLVFLEAKGNKPRGLILDGPTGRAVDLSYLSRHLFEGYTILGWAYAEDPYQALHAARSDGALLTMTYLPETGVMAWTRGDHGGGGKFEEMVSIPEGSEDGVYAAVRYPDGRLALERFSHAVLPGEPVANVGEIAVPDTRYAIQLDGSASYNGRNTDASKTITLQEYLGGGWNLGATVQITFGAAFSELSLGDTIEVDVPGSTYPVRVMVSEVASTTVFRAQITDCQPSNSATVESSVPAAIRDTATADWWLCASLIPVGNPALNDATGLAVLADGAVIDDATVAGGVCGLPRPCAIAHVGFPFIAEMETLGVAGDRGKEKTISEVLVELEHTRGASVGETLSGATKPLALRKVADGYGRQAPVREKVRVSVSSSWNTEGRVAVRQLDPLPMTVVGLTREMVRGY